MMIAVTKLTAANRMLSLPGGNIRNKRTYPHQDVKCVLYIYLIFITIIYDCI